MSNDECKGVNFNVKVPFVEEVAKGIVDCAFKVHTQLGPGLLENIYEGAFCHELRKAGFCFEQQVSMPVIYDGIKLGEGYRIDVLVEDLIICELKAVTEIHPVYKAQLLSYMKLAQKELGFLINFNVPLIKQGISRFKL